MRPIVEPGAEDDRTDDLGLVGPDLNAIRGMQHFVGQGEWACAIPETLTFHTEPELSLAMITDLVQRGELPFRWVTCDERYGEIPAFLDGIAALDKWYFAEMAVDTHVWLQCLAVEPPGPGVLGRPRLHPRVSRTTPRPQSLREVMEGLPARAWHVHLIKEGSKGPIAAIIQTPKTLIGAAQAEVS